MKWTEEQKAEARERIASRKLLDTRPVEVLSRREAHERFPDRGYNEYDPCVIIVGTRKAIERDVQIQVTFIVGDKNIVLPVRNFNALTEGSDAIDNMVSVDVSKMADYRLAIFEEFPEEL